MKYTLILTTLVIAGNLYCQEKEHANIFNVNYAKCITSENVKSVGMQALLSYGLLMTGSAVHELAHAAAAATLIGPKSILALSVGCNKLPYMPQRGFTLGIGLNPFKGECIFDTTLIRNLSTGKQRLALASICAAGPIAGCLFYNTQYKKLQQKPEDQSKNIVKLTTLCAFGLHALNLSAAIGTDGNMIRQCLNMKPLPYNACLLGTALAGAGIYAAYQQKKQ